MQLRPPEMVATQRMRTIECFVCGTCVDSFKKGAIRWRFGKAE